MKSCKGLKEKEENSSSVIGFREKNKSNKEERRNKKEGIKRKDSAKDRREEELNNSRE